MHALTNLFEQESFVADDIPNMTEDPDPDANDTHRNTGDMEEEVNYDTDESMPALATVYGSSDEE